MLHGSFWLYLGRTIELTYGTGSIILFTLPISDWMCEPPEADQETDMLVRAYLRAPTKEQDANRAKEDLRQFAEERGHRISAFY